MLTACLAALSGLLIFVGTLGLGRANAPRANAQIQVETSKEIQEEYAFGDEFAIPDCTFTRNGESVKGTASLQFPDGSETNDTDVTLNQSGKYALRYIATIADKAYTKEYAFTVYGRLASYENDKTSISYEHCTDFGADSMGLMVRIANGDSLSFDHIFEMNQLTMATKLLEGFIVPSVQGSADFTKMVFTFTDVEDPSVQLVYHGNFHDDSNAYGLTYFTAAGNGQVHCGLEYVGKLHVGSNLGCMVPHSFIAKDTGLYWGAQPPKDAAPDAKTFCISYDAKSNQAWAGGKIISDLDDGNYYTSAWSGFPSGKAKLTISALNYNNATANICFTSILGVALEAQNFIDEEAPVITVDNSYKEMPVAVVGKTYPVPQASAMDLVNGACKTQATVWYNYGAAEQKMVDVANGRFAVKNVGAYAIVYEASDYSGNIAREILWVRAKLSVDTLTISADKAYPTKMVVGKVQTLPNVEMTGGSGDKTVTYELRKGKKTCEIIDGQFCLEEAGEWTLTCMAMDYVGNLAVTVCPITAEISDKPIITAEPKLPAAYISDAAYTLPILYAYDYTSGKKVEKLCSVIVEYGEHTATYNAGEVFVPSVETDGHKVKISYACDGAVLNTQEIPVRVVFGTERIPGAVERYRDVVYVEKYFYTQSDLTITNQVKLGETTGLTMTANQAADAVKATFINPQMANFFSLKFATMPNLSKFSQLAVTLTDSENASISVKVVLTKQEEQTIVTVGDVSAALAFDFDGALSVGYTLSYANGVITADTASLRISKTENEEPFNGFPSGKIIFDVEMYNVEAGASLFLQEICGISVSGKQDNASPFVSLADGTQPITNAFKGSVYIVKGVMAGDLLSPNVQALLTVYAPDGRVIKSVDGILLKDVDATKDYRIKLATYGEYLVDVTVTEAYGWKFTNAEPFKYLISVVDGEPPKITFKGSFKTNLKVGDLLVIPEYKLSDNFTAAKDLTVMTVITNPKGLPVYLYGKENAIRCQYAGVYKVQIFVYDEMGNLTTFEKSVTVK